MRMLKWRPTKGPCRRGRPSAALLTPALAVAMAIAAPATSAQGNDYYVSPTGSDANPGTLARPWQTIAHALDGSGPGDTVQLRQGTYAERVEMRGDHGHGGAAGVWWTLRSFPGETATLTDNFGMYMASFSRVQGLRVDGATIGANPWTTSGNLPCHDVEIVGNVLVGAQPRYAYIFVSGTDILVEGNTIQSTGGGDTLDHGIYIARSTGIVARDNVISGVSCWGIQIYDEKKQPDEPDGYRLIAGATIEGNTIGVTGCGGIIVATGSSGAPDARDILIRNNVVQVGTSAGIEVRHNTDRVHVFGNTLVSRTVGNHPLEIATCCGSPAAGDHIADLSIADNIFVLAGAGADHVRVGSSATITGLRLWNNLYAPGPARVTGVTDEAPVEGAAGFVDAVAGDFHLTSTSAALDRGVELSELPTDKDGVARPQGVATDMGAYERAIPCTADTDCATPPPCRTASGATCGAGDCSYPAAPAGSTCDNGNACTGDDACDDTGLCVSGPWLCGPGLDAGSSATDGGGLPLGEDRGCGCAVVGQSAKGRAGALLGLAVLLLPMLRRTWARRKR